LVLRRIEIENFKSLVKLELDLGRVNVFIGENGSGKSNILEGIGFAAAGINNKLDNEFLTSRGIRVVEPRFMLPAFGEAAKTMRIQFADVDGRGGTFGFQPKRGPYPRWDLVVQHLRKAGHPSDTAMSAVSAIKWDDEILRGLYEAVSNEDLPPEQRDSLVTQVLAVAFELSASPFGLRDYVVFSPEASALRTFATEGQIVPLGVRGEGLFKFLGVMSAPEHRERWTDLKTHLRMLDWFEDVEVPTDLAPFEHTLKIRDRFLHIDAYFDQRSSNEAFLYLLFYLALIVGPETPRIFAVDNIEASLNPSARGRGAAREALRGVLERHPRRPSAELLSAPTMATFAIAAEGYTDQVVIRHVLEGYFESDDELETRFVQPDIDATGATETTRREASERSSTICVAADTATRCS
jgi:hypothetical protein